METVVKMRAFLWCLALWAISVPGLAWAEDLRAIMRAVRADRWEDARDLARQAGTLEQDIVTWRWLRAGEGVFDDYRQFLLRNGDWPGLDRVRARGEAAIKATDDPRHVIAYFDGRQPVTGAGGLALTRAYDALGMTADAEAQAVLTWHTLPLAAPAHGWMMDQFGHHLAPHHTTRLDAMLWQGEAASARLMLDLVPRDWRALAVARLTLRSNGPGVDKLVEAVPPALADDPGLAYERFRWRAAKGFDESAIALLDEQSVSAAMLGQPAEWAGRRRSLARQMMRAGKSELAYRLAANNYLTEGTDYADLEWLAGFIALRQLNEPAVALAHFDRFTAAVETPISLGRAGYWRGRALTAMGRAEEARAAFAAGAEHQTSFYGQLASEELGMPMSDELIAGRDPAAWSNALFAGSSVLRAARLFHEADERNLTEWFLTHLAESSDAAGQRGLVELALSWDEPHIALRLAKAAAGQGVVVPQGYFPVTDLARLDQTVAPELVLAIARRESEFDPVVVSGAGARGLMQLMPGTAQDMARTLSLPYSPAALLSDPSYNARLGTAYLAELIAEFGHNYVLVAAAYNAGPSRVRGWIAAHGDPRSAGVDVIDWIEKIPFRETRNYVMRVTESLAIYRARLAGRVVSFDLSDELKAY